MESEIISSFESLPKEFKEAFALSRYPIFSDWMRYTCFALGVQYSEREERLIDYSLHLFFDGFRYGEKVLDWLQDNVKRKTFERLDAEQLQEIKRWYEHIVKIPGDEVLGALMFSDRKRGPTEARAMLDGQVAYSDGSITNLMHPFFPDFGEEGTDSSLEYYSQLRRELTADVSKGPVVLYESYRHITKTRYIVGKLNPTRAVYFVLTGDTVPTPAEGWKVHIRDLQEMGTRACDVGGRFLFEDKCGDKRGCLATLIQNIGVFARSSGFRVNLNKGLAYVVQY